MVLPIEKIMSYISLLESLWMHYLIRVIIAPLNWSATQTPVKVMILVKYIPVGLLRNHNLNLFQSRDLSRICAEGFQRSYL